MPKWNYIPIAIPADNQVVYVRLYNGLSDVFLATFHLDSQTCTFPVTNISYPIWMIAKWRAQ